jgi:hypothetical protein
MFIGMSPSHSSNVGRFLNLRTGNVSPQFHVVYDDLFSTVPNGETGGVVEEMAFNPHSWMKILETGWERNVDLVDGASSGSRFVPSLDPEWLSDEELPPSVTRHEREERIVRFPSLPVSSTRYSGSSTASTTSFVSRGKCYSPCECRAGNFSYELCRGRDIGYRGRSRSGIQEQILGRGSACKTSTETKSQVFQLLFR